MIMVFSPRIGTKLRQLLQTITIAVAVTAITMQSAMAAGPIIINEVMPNPLIINDADGEWIELWNVGSSPQAINGWKITDESDEEIIESTASIAVGATFVLCRNDDKTENGGIDCDYELQEIALSNSDTITLKRPVLAQEIGDTDDPDFVTVDSITYDIFDEKPGASTIPDRDNQTHEPTLDEDDEQIFENDEINSYDDNNAGTPGEITLADLIDTHSSLGAFDQLLDAIRLSDACNLSALLRSNDEKVSYTVFAPSNSAVAALPALEANELLSNPDELCELIAYHIVVGEKPILASDVPTALTNIETLSGDIIDTMWDGDDSLAVQRNGLTVKVDSATVTNADLIADNGVIHIIDQILLPRNPAVTIDQVTGLSTKPQLTGTYSVSAEEDYNHVCVLVRSNGSAYFPAILDGEGGWVIPAGLVEINPHTNTLFSVVLRACNAAEAESLNSMLACNNCDGEFEGTTYGDELLALSMQFDPGEPLPPPPPPTPPSTPPKVLGATTVSTVTKGSLGGDNLYSNNTQEIEAADNGVVTDGDGTQTTPDNETNDNQASNWYWWFISAGTVAIVWYALWRRQDVS